MVVIVISGKPGAGTSTVGKLVAKRLKLKHFSTGDYYKRKIAKSKSHSVKALATKEGSSKTSHKAIDKMQADLARKGNIVIISKLGIKMVKNDFSVWLNAGIETTAKRMAKQEKIPLKEARKLIKERYANERKMFKKIYGFDTFSQERMADLVINTSNKTPKKITDTIIKKLKDL